jgi:hypothetical protein
MKLVRLLIGLTVLTLTSTSDALACSCSSSGPPCQNTFQVDVVFAGTVRTIVPLPEDGPPLRPGEMRIPKTVRVQFDTVVPFRGLQVSNAGIKTGPNGTFDFLVHEGLSYLARASFWDEGQRKQVAGTVGPFLIGGDVAPLRVVLSVQR